MALHKNTMLLLVVTLLTGGVSGYTLDDARRLLSNLSSDYDPAFRPVYNQSTAVHVGVSFDIVSIQEFDEINEKLTVTGILFQTWTDEVFTWKPSDYGGAEYLTLHTNDVWVPAMSHVNTAKPLERIAEDWHLLSVNSNGTVAYIMGNVFTSSCNIDVSYYPWDRQWCSFMFSTWAYSPADVRLVAISNTISTTYYTDNGLWKLADSSAHVESGQTITFGLVLDREPLYVVINAVVPIAFMSLLNLLVFLIPIECGERISYCITVLLAIAVFLTLVGDHLPKTSNPASLYGYYLLVVLAISVCITLGTITSLLLYYRDPEVSINSFWRALVKLFRCEFKACVRSNSIGKCDSTQAGFRVRRQREEPSDRNQTNNEHLNSISETSLRRMYPEESKDVTFATIPDVTSWHDVSIAVDKLCLVVFCLLSIGSTVVFVIVISQGQDKNKQFTFNG